MFAWLTPWVYLVVIALCYFAPSGKQAQMRRWILDHRNVWLAIAIALAAIGIAGALFWRARWLHVAAWMICIGATVWTAYRMRTYEKDSAIHSGLPIDLDK
ncbi:MAG: hypothetical protein N2Z21_06235 [Candidatus Sumerlaeaceae bacterium]|nr:hypothetical protein [Candidatus Sumerlaeaceae bacterium]